jgi:hypothetical protein
MNSAGPWCDGRAANRQPGGLLSLGSCCVHHQSIPSGGNTFLRSRLMKIIYLQALRPGITDSSLSWVLVTIRNLSRAILARAMRGCRLLC